MDYIERKNAPVALLVMGIVIGTVLSSVARAVIEFASHIHIVWK